MQITQASLTDLEQIMAIERAGFTPEEAGSRQAFIDRINHFPETFFGRQSGGHGPRFYLWTGPSWRRH